jgi:hypothetical protein
LVPLTNFTLISVSNFSLVCLSNFSLVSVSNFYLISVGKFTLMFKCIILLDIDWSKVSFPDCRFTFLWKKVVEKFKLTYWLQGGKKALILVWRRLCFDFVCLLPSCLTFDITPVLYIFVFGKSQHRCALKIWNDKITYCVHLIVNFVFHWT